MAVSKKRKGGRKSAKQYTFVSFNFADFNDPFELPSHEQMPVGVAMEATKGNLDRVVQWWVDAGADGSCVEDFLGLTADETEDFITAWQAGNPVGLGKSGS